MELKYLFIAEFQDGSVIEQEPADKSLIDPEKRSRFFDVLQQVEAGNHVVRFSLRGAGHIYTVDLIDGHFEVDGVSFKMIEGVLPEYRIVFFRRHTHSFNVNVDGEQKEVGHDIVYRMGWQCTITDPKDKEEKNYQRVMEIE